MVDRFRRLVVATGIPSAVLARVELDPLATPTSATRIVRSYVGREVWLAMLGARTLPARASILLPAIDARAAADEAAETDPHRKAA